MLEEGRAIGFAGTSPSRTSGLPPPSPVLRGPQFITHHLVASLSDDQLATIEQHRGAGDLSLLIDVPVRMPGIQDAWPTQTDQRTVRIAASRWLQQLELVGAAASFTIVVPAPLADGDRARMGAHLLTAET